MKKDANEGSVSERELIYLFILPKTQAVVQMGSRLGVTKCSRLLASRDEPQGRRPSTAV